jgi:hypothetical protein
MPVESSLLTSVAAARQRENKIEGVVDKNKFEC